MANEIVPKARPLPDDLFSMLAINPSRDRAKLSISAGVITANVQKPDGKVFSARFRAHGALTQLTKFDPSKISIDERKKLEKEMHGDGLSQAEIADMLGVSQATVSLDLGKLKLKKKAGA